MKTLKERQDEFVETLSDFEAWNEKFNYFIELSDLLPAACPAELFPFRIASCQSRTYFRAWIEDGWLRVNGWSNATTQRGIILSMIEMFDRVPASELIPGNDIYFHEKSDLINNLTPLRQEGLKEMINRILVLYRGKE